MSKAKILIVEDEVIIAIQLEEKLKSLSYEVTSTVNNASDAIRKTEEDKPDLILMDIRIQGDKDGIETAEIIRERFGVPVVFSTAYLDQERIERAKITMPFGYVLKPIQDRDLKVTLEMALYVAKVNTEREQAEAIKIKEEIRYRRLFESHCDAIYLLTEEGSIIDVNDSACHALERSRKELLSLTIGDVDPNFDQKGFKQFWDGRTDEKTHTFETLHRKSDGTIFPVEVVGVPFIHDGNRLLYGFAKDITDRKQAETARRLAEDECRLSEKRGCETGNAANRGRPYLYGDQLNAGYQ